MTTPEAGTVDPALRERLEGAAEGLLYGSEGDEPFDFFALPWPEGEPVTLAAFAARLGAPADGTMKEMDLDRFLRNHVEHVDPYDDAAQALRPRYERLRDTLRESVREVRVFRVGEVQVHCYAVGRDGRGNLAGLHTVAIET